MSSSLNESELGVLTGNEFGDSDEPKRFIGAALSLGGRDKIICVTLGARGVLALIDGAPLMIPGRPVKAVDTTGAGDCFVGALAAQLARGATVPYALNYANAAALRSACSGWARRHRCRRLRRWKGSRRSPRRRPGPIVKASAIS